MIIEATKHGTNQGSGKASLSMFIGLQWKRFIRSASFGRKLIANLVLTFLGLFVLLYVALIGWIIIPLLKEQMPGEDPFGLVCSVGFAWMVLELALRMFFLQAGTMQVRPLLILPVRRASIVHYVLAGSILSYFLLAVAVLLLALGASLIHNGYAPAHVAGWCIGLLLTSAMLGQLSLFAGRKFRFLLAILVALAAVGGAHALGYIKGTSKNRKMAF